MKRLGRTAPDPRWQAPSERTLPITTALEPGTPETLCRAAALSCDAVVAATDIPGFQSWLLPSLADVPEVRATANLEALGSVWIRVVTESTVREEDPPMGIFAGRFRLLDTYFRLSSYQDEFAAFRDRTGGEVLELHAYLASRELGCLTRAMARNLIEPELYRAWPELRGRIVHMEFGFNERTFAKQGVGHGRFQPRMRTAVPDLVLCGSWIKTEEAVHDMEKAVVTGLRAANHLLTRHGHPPFPVVPLRGRSVWQRIAGAVSPALPKPSGVLAAPGVPEPRHDVGLFHPRVRST